MTTQKSVFALASAALLVAAPAMGQVLNHPVMALPQGPDDGATFLAVQYGRGLNEDSNKRNSFLVAGGRAMQRVSFSVAGGYALDYLTPDNSELSLAASVGVHLLSDDSTPVQLTAQAGFGWASLSSIGGDITDTHFPIGLAISGRGSDSGSSIRPWVMPRLDIRRRSNDTSSESETGFGASAGVSFTSEGGAGVHLAIDWLSGEEGGQGSPFGLGIGVHYLIG